MTKGLFLSFAILGGLSISTIILSLLIRTRYSKDPDTPTELIPKIIKLMDLQPSDKFIDLGAGDFRMVNTVAKYCQSYGVELSPVHLVTAQLLRLLNRRRSHILTENLLKTDLTKYNKIYLNLDSKIIRALATKLPTKAGVIIYSLNDKLENIEATKVHELNNSYTLFEYQFK